MKRVGNHGDLASGGTWSLFEDTPRFRKVSIGLTVLVVKPFTRSDE